LVKSLNLIFQAKNTGAMPQNNEGIANKTAEIKQQQ